MAYRLGSLFIILVDAVMAFIAFFLGMRVIFELFNANSSTPFVAWINQVSGALMYPFQGIFPNIQISTFGSLDLVALISLLAYSIIGYLIIGAIRTFARPTVTDTIHTREHHVV